MTGSYGELLLTLIRDEQGDRLHIDQADPRILISTCLIDMLLADPPLYVSLEDDVLRVVADNGVAVYRIGKPVPELWAYEAEWPD